MFIFLLVNNFFFAVAERRIHSFKYFKDPFMIQVQVPQEQGAPGLMGEDDNGVQFMSVRPHAYTNYDFNYEDGEEEQESSPNPKPSRKVSTVSRGRSSTAQ
jgi:hypothetical protein